VVVALLRSLRCCGRCVDVDRCVDAYRPIDALMHSLMRLLLLFVYVIIILSIAVDLFFVASADGIVYLFHSVEVCRWFRSVLRLILMVVDLVRTG
jgi:hypothetical protein